MRSFESFPKEIPYLFTLTLYFLPGRVVFCNAPFAPHQMPENTPAPLKTTVRYIIMYPILHPSSDPVFRRRWTMRGRPRRLPIPQEGNKRLCKENKAFFRKLTKIVQTVQKIRKITDEFLQNDECFPRDFLAYLCYNRAYQFCLVPGNASGKGKSCENAPVRPARTGIKCKKGGPLFAACILCKPLDFVNLGYSLCVISKFKKIK